jgi:Flp pilus assembly protein CpaB
MNRIGVLVVAAVVALASSIGLVRYASGAQDRAVQATQPVPVMVVSKDVAAGTQFSAAWNEGSITMSETLQSLRPDTAVLDPKALTGLVATAGLTKGQLIVQGSFIDPSKTEKPGPPTFANDLPDGTVAVSFEAKSAQAVADLIRPGDHVNLLVQVPNASVFGLPDSGGAAVVHVFQDLQIIAIGAVLKPKQDATEAPANPGTGVYTVAIPAEDSARLLLLAHEYDLFLTLVGPKNTPGDIPPIADKDALPAVTVPTSTTVPDPTASSTP